MALDPHGLHRPEGAPLRSYEEARLDQLRASPAYQLVIRCLWTRGEEQVAALRALRERGLYLSPDQREQAGLPREESDHVP